MKLVDGRETPKGITEFFKKDSKGRVNMKTTREVSENMAQSVKCLSYKHKVLS